MECTLLAPLRTAPGIKFGRTADVGHPLYASRTFEIRVVGTCPAQGNGTPALIPSLPWLADLRYPFATSVNAAAQEPAGKRSGPWTP